MSLNLLNFHKPFLAKKVLFICLRNFRSCSFLGRILLFSFTMSKLQALWKFLVCDTSATKLLVAKPPRIDRTTRVIKQNINRMLHSKNFQFYCSNLATPPFASISSSFGKISTKCSKKGGMLATLVKFSQASNSHLSRQQNFVKKRSIHTA